MPLSVFGRVAALKVQWKRQPGTLAAVAVLLGVGSAAATIAFAVWWAVWASPLPFERPSELIALRVTSGTAPPTGVSPAEFEDWSERLGRVSAIASFETRKAEVVLAADARLVTTAAITPNLFGVLGVSAIRGRTLAVRDLDDDRTPAVISHRLWTALGRSDQVVERSLVLRDAVREWEIHVVGVLPATVELAYAEPIDVYVLAPPAPLVRAGTHRALISRTVIGRLATGATVSSAEVELSGVLRSLEHDYAQQPRGRLAAVEPLRHTLLGASREASWLYAAVGIGVMVIAVINGLSVLIAAGVARARDLRLRIALGATPTHIWTPAIGQWGALLVVLVPVSALAAGAIRAVWLSFAPALTPRLDSVPSVSVLMVGAAVLAGAATLTIVALAHGISLVLARRMNQLGLQARGASGAIRSFSRLLVSSQVGLGLPVCVLAGLFAASAERMVSRSFGFDISAPVIAEVRMSVPLRSTEAYRSVIDEIVSQSTASGFTTGVAFEPPLASVPGRTRVSLADGRSADVYHGIISEGYWEALGVTAEVGRTFSRSDRFGPPTAVVNRRFAQMYLGGSSAAIGQVVSLGRDHTVVGVVPDIQDLDVRADSRPSVFVPFATDTWKPTRLFVVASRSAATVSDPQELRSAIQRAVGTVAISAERLDARLAVDLDPLRFAATSLGFLMVVAIGLLVAGVVAVTVTSLAERRTEFGIRLALGATILHLRTLAISTLGVALVTGVVLGLVMAGLLVRWTSSLLFETPPFEVATWFWSVLVLLGSVGVASWLATARVKRLDPSELLRT